MTIDNGAYADLALASSQRRSMLMIKVLWIVERQKIAGAPSHLNQ